MKHEIYMAEALALARKAQSLGEIPVGCVIVHKDKIIGRGYNTREKNQNAVLHAEMCAITEACAALKSWRLENCALYVTLEPCPMCAGAIMNARIKEIYYGASDPSFGACGGVINIFEEAFGFKPKIFGGILKEPSTQILSDFFSKMRKGADKGTVHN